MENGKYITARKAAEALGYEYKYFAALLKAGKVTGAVQEGGRWRVPLEFVEAGRRRARITPELEDEILERFRSGAQTPMEIHRELGIKKSTIYNIIHQDDKRMKQEREREENNQVEHGRGWNETASVKVRVAGRIIKADEPTTIEIDRPATVKVTYDD